MQLDLTVDLSSENPPRSNPQCSNPGTFAQAFASSSHLGDYPTRPRTVARGGEAMEGWVTWACHKLKKADKGKGNGTLNQKQMQGRKQGIRRIPISTSPLHQTMEPWCSDVGQMHTQDGTRTTCLSCTQPRPTGGQVVSGSNRMIHAY